VAAPDGSLYVNLTGNPGMATAGTGDVLAGVIGALAAQGLPALEAARLGVHVHGLAGDLCAREGEIGLMASDLAGQLPRALRETAGVQAPI
jgi:NAD(P)H-hydrate epimerase